jgi:uncharacterized membrane protein YGL010W
VPPRPLEALLQRYDRAHRHPANAAIHCACVPVITWGVLALLWALSPAAAYVALGAALAYYLWLSPAIAVGMLAVVAVMVYPLALLGTDALPAGVVAFVLGGIGQFAGHKIEGTRPAFLGDLRFLLVGPAWVLASLYRRLGIAY